MSRLVFSLIALVLAAPVFAKDPVRNGSVIGRPAITIDEEDCRLEISKQFIALGQIDDVVLADAKARAICAEAAGDLTKAYAEARVIDGRVGNDSLMTFGAAVAAAQGGSTSYVASPGGTVDIKTGSAATASAMGNGIVGTTYGLNPALYGAGGYDPRLDGAAMIAGQAFAGFNASQHATEAWQGQAALESQSRIAVEGKLKATKAQVAEAKAEAIEARADAAKIAAEKEAIESDMAELLVAAD